MEAIISGINWLDDFIWGMPMIVLLLGTHLFMTVRTGFIQRKTFTGIRLSVRKDPDAPGDVSQFQALTTALASVRWQPRSRQPSARATSSAWVPPYSWAALVRCSGAGLPACSESPPSTQSPLSP